MSIILELRNRFSHAGVPLVHPTSEDVVLASVFGVIKNLEAKTLVNIWLRTLGVIDDREDSDWEFSFWESQPKPVGIVEGSTEVDLVLASEGRLVFVEVKIDAEPSRGTTHDPARNQLIRNLDIGYKRALAEKKDFALIYITPALKEPQIVVQIKQSGAHFPVNPDIDPGVILQCLQWTSWSTIGDAAAKALKAGQPASVEKKLLLDLLAYLCAKRLWENTLEDSEEFYREKLYRSLRKTDSPFIPYAEQAPERYHEWRAKQWGADTLRDFLLGLPPKDKALLKILADAEGAMPQHAIMSALPFLQGKTSAALRSRKSHINAGCKSHDRAPILSQGIGSGDWRIHEINRELGELRNLVLETAKAFEIRWELLGSSEKSYRQKSQPTRTKRFTPSKNKEWYVDADSDPPLIYAFVNAKGSCSCRKYSLASGSFIRRHRAKSRFQDVFASLIEGLKVFAPDYQPDLVSTEKTGLPKEILAKANEEV